MWTCKECGRSNLDAIKECECGGLRDVKSENNVDYSIFQNSGSVSNSEPKPKDTVLSNKISKMDYVPVWMTVAGVIFPLFGWLLIAALVVRGDDTAAGKLWRNVCIATVIICIAAIIIMINAFG